MIPIKICLLISVLVSVTYSGEVPLQNTCNTNSKIVSFQVTDCTKLPCTFQRGKTYFIKLVFTLGRNSSQISIKCRSDPAVVGQFQQIADVKACDGLSGDKCPIIADKPYTFATNVTIAPVPPRTYTVLCEIVDDQNTNQICISGKANIEIPLTFPFGFWL